jgi:hypothetical protein
MEQMGDRIAVLAGGLVTLNVAAPGAGAIITIFVSGLAIGAAVIVWISLLIRKGSAAHRDRLRAHRARRVELGPHPRLGGQVGDLRARPDPVQVVLVVIFLLATAQVSAPIDSDLQSISDPIAGVVLMLMAGFAPYLTYKAISFMGFDMYHAMSAEQEAKSALNRPLPVPMSRPSRLAAEQGARRPIERRRRTHRCGCPTASRAATRPPEQEPLAAARHRLLDFGWHLPLLHFRLLCIRPMGESRSVRCAQRAWASPSRRDRWGARRSRSGALLRNTADAAERGTAEHRRSTPAHVARSAPAQPNGTKG